MYVYTIYCILYTVYYILYGTAMYVYTVYYTVLPCMYTVYCILYGTAMYVYTVYCILYGTAMYVYTVYCIYMSTLFLFKKSRDNMLNECLLVDFVILAQIKHLFIHWHSANILYSYNYDDINYRMIK